MNRKLINKMLVVILIIGNILGAYAYYVAVKYRSIVLNRPTDSFFDYINPFREKQKKIEPSIVFDNPVLRLTKEVLLKKPEWAFNAQTIEESEIWKHKLRRKITELLAIPATKNIDLNARVIEKAEVDNNLIKETVIFDGYNGKVIGCVFIPKGGKEPLPAIVVFSGHKKGIIETTGKVSSYQNSNALELARRGFITITIENRGFGMRGGSHYDDIEIGLARGIPVMGLMVYDGLKALDYICTRKEVDPQRIGVCGVSLGGELSLYVAALDDGVKCTVIAGFLTTYENLLVTITHCPCFIVPGLINFADYSDIASLIAPRPLRFQAGIEDIAFDIKEAEKAFTKIEKAYKVYNRKENLSLYKFKGGHEFKVDNSYEWFQKWRDF